MTEDSILETISHIRVSDLVDAKRRGEKWAMLTCHDPITAKIFDKAKIPCLLVSDLAAHTVYGYKSRARLTIDEMIPLARAVKSSCERALVVADLPYGSYEESPKVALRSATRLIKETGVDAVKLEGGDEIIEQVKLLSVSGIPVIFHIGLCLRKDHSIGAYTLEGRDGTSGMKLHLPECRHLQMSGAIACLIDWFTDESVCDIRKEMEIPIIGIGSGSDCDAQLMIWQDMAGFNAPESNESSSLPSKCSSELLQDSAPEKLTTAYQSTGIPRNLKKYTNLGEMLFRAAVAFREDVRSGAYPE